LLQTYHRYGYHVSNAVEAETLLVLRKRLIPFEDEHRLAYHGEDMPGGSQHAPCPTNWLASAAAANIAATWR
jgi:hypothetical protein